MNANGILVVRSFLINRTVTEMVPRRVYGEVGYKKEQFSLALQEWGRRARSKSPTMSKTILNNGIYLFI